MMHLHFRKIPTPDMSSTAKEAEEEPGEDVSGFSDPRSPINPPSDATLGEMYVNVIPYVTLSFLTS